MELIQSVITEYKKIYGNENVFPTQQHLDESQVCIRAHHEGKGETYETLHLRAQLMLRYFKKIAEADTIVFVNEKYGKEYYGVGTLIELGYAFAHGKRILFYHTPTNANIQSLHMCHAYGAY